MVGHKERQIETALLKFGYAFLWNSKPKKTNEDLKKCKLDNYCV